jgi:hypothetical protein
MRRRRQRLQVSTFPFLAVLLCTMGSLILLLLVLDRRAKIVALHKVRDDFARVKADKDRREQERLRKAAEDERQAAEWQRRRDQLRAALADQEQELVAQVEQARGKVADAEATLRAEQARATELRQQLQTAQGNLRAEQETVKAQQAASAKAAELTEAAKRELARQALELEQLEQTLAQLKALRERQKNTYSLVPYLGKRGDSRQPVYVECAGGGLVFHPDATPLPEMSLTSETVRAEVEKRVARQRGAVPAGQDALRPYVLMLIRPDGILNYYHAQQALGGMKVDFGYELVEADWVLDFSGKADVTPPAWTAGAKAPPLPGASAVPSPPPPAGARIGVAGSAPAQVAPPGGSGKGYGGTFIGGNPGQSFPFYPQSVGGGGSGIGGQVSPSTPHVASAGGNVGSGSSVTPQGAGGGWSPGPAAPLAPQSSGGGAIVGPQSSGGGGLFGQPSRLAQQPPGGTGTGGPPSALAQDASGKQGRTPFEGSGGMPNGLPPKPPSSPGPQGERGPGGEGPSLDGKKTGNDGSAVAGKGTGGDGKSPSEAGSGAITLSGPLPATGAKGASLGPPLGRVLANRDWFIYLECTAEGVTLTHGNQKFPVDTLTVPTTGEHPLVETVRQLIAKRQATVLPGEPPYRPLLRFQVRPDGQRAYYRAYPLLETLRLPMSRENLQ